MCYTNIFRCRTIYSEAKASTLERWICLVIFAGLAAVRIPEILGQGRFWAEEGQIFFVNGLENPWYKAIFFSYGGYLNITANLAGILAHVLVPLKAAPYVTSILGLVLQSCPAALICFCSSSNSDNWLQNRYARLTALLVVLTLPASQEIWLSTIGSQVHLNLCVGLILVLGSEGFWYRTFQKILLVLAPLSGPGGSFLIPLFYLRAFLERSQERLMQALILTACSILQLTFFWHAQERNLSLDPQLFLHIIFVKHLLIPFWGLPATDLFALSIRNDWEIGKISQPVMSVTIGASLAWGAILLHERKQIPGWFFASGVILACLAYFGALGNKADLLLAQPGYRYAFAPQILIELSFVSMAFLARGKVQILSRILCTWLLVIAMHEYFVTPPIFREGPTWRSEVRRWNSDPTYVPKVWPAPWCVRSSKLE